MTNKAILLPLLSALFLAEIFTASAEPAPLPQPLTLEQALSYAGDKTSPELAAIDSRKMALSADDDLLQASSATQLSFMGQLQWAEPLATPGSWVDNHNATLLLHKNIYDFGRIEGNRAANRISLKALQSERVAAHWQRRELIMNSFFNVLLADRIADRNDEEMAGAFIRFDRISQRQKLGQASDLEVMESESLYQSVFLKRNRGIAQQRLTRSQLAITLNRVGDLPEELAPPQLPATNLPLPKYEEILKKALAENSALEAIAQKIAAARQQISATSKGRLPTINGEIELADTTRPTGTSDRWRIGLNFSMPLYDGGSNSAQIASIRATIYKLQAERDGLKAAIEQSVLSEWLDLKALRQQATAVLIELDYRELYLDNSRAEYELEFKTDLGNAMVKISEAQLEIERNRYQQALAWERLNALTNAGMAALSTQVASEKQATAEVQ